MPAPSLLGTAVKAALDAFPGVVEHPNGHSETLLRYVAPTGAPFAVGRTEVNGVRFWVLEDQAFHDLVLAAGLACETHVPKPRGSSGRNSNLDQIPEFKRKPLNWVRVTAPAESVSVLACLLATSSPVLIEPTPDPAPEVSPTVPPAPAPVADAGLPACRPPARRPFSGHPRSRTGFRDPRRPAGRRSRAPAASGPRVTHRGAPRPSRALPTLGRRSP